MLFFHLFSQETGGGGDEFVVRFGGSCPSLGAKIDDASANVAGGDDGRRRKGGLVNSLNGEEELFALAAAAVNRPAVHKVLQLRRDTPFQKLLFRETRGGYYVVPVANDHRASANFKKNFGVLPGELGQFADGRIFFKNNLAVIVRENFQRVALADTHRAADLLRNHDPPEVVPLCQERDKKINDFFKKPGAAWFLSFLKR